MKAEKEKNIEYNSKPAVKFFSHDNTSFKVELLMYVCVIV